VEAIFEATIQVLLTPRGDRLTTTRVAERAGVSVGTLYRYYPNKESLLFAVVENHLEKMTVAVEAACELACHKRRIIRFPNSVDSTATTLRRFGGSNPQGVAIIRRLRPDSERFVRVETMKELKRMPNLVSPVLGRQRHNRVFKQ
jgi:AcrR family transcriptional regulator